MKRRPCCVEEMNARREQKCTDSEKVWGLPRASAFLNLQSLAVLAAWDGHSEQAIGHLREAAGLAAEIGLPAEQWQILAALGRVYEAGGGPAQAHTAFAEAARIIGGLAEGITDEALRARFLAGPQILPVLQHAQSEASSVSQVQAEPSRC
jgi:hypothetical protein